jgi:CRISPR-associated endonuclease/helicase Cas3
LSGTILDSRRREIINYLKNKNNRSKKILLITTQVVEAGVDIDMDLGFKNISLIDSDEQLAGRVNRNVTKEACEVYLFKINEPSQLYKKDYRYSITRDSISTDEHADILRSKDFEKLYSLVLNHIDKLNGLKELQNFNSDYLPEIKKLDYKKVHDKFQLIEQKNLSVFVPLSLPKYLLSAEGKEEAVFSVREISFLSGLGVSIDADEIRGLEVWQAYKQMIAGNGNDFIAKQIDRKLMSGILGKFTFSIYANPKIQASLKSFSFPADDKENELRGFDNYIYLAHHDKCYDFQKGLMESKFEDSENFIL